MQLDFDINHFQPKRGVPRYTVNYDYYDWLNSFNNESGWSGVFDLITGWQWQVLEEDKKRLGLRKL